MFEKLRRRNRGENLDLKKIKPLIKLALKEDIGSGDITSDITVPRNLRVKAVIITKEKAIIAGLSVCRMVFKLIDDRTGFVVCVREGERVGAGTVVARISGKAEDILAGERVALNFLGRLSGIATKTARFVNKSTPYGTVIMDTRKTTPGWRLLEKYAVSAGGGRNHRMGLYDGVLIKDNHLKLAAVSIGDVVAGARKSVPSEKIEVEVASISEVHEALKGKPDIIMLDNMPAGKVRKAVKIIKKADSDIVVEVSGGIKFENVETFAAAGADVISVGSLTHSVHNIDMSMEMERDEG